ncbi:hypothetical protein CEXT_509241 [Caerostris extrusa]|uniref:Uncharacterized protein n=1 Tax=Caerostris extrusa TaxID=172846 RepID=A0AAV4VZT1_CAEEX|nr:hypothetical protein CEXT_509241 [Caerostris extrusa]
MSVLLRFLSNLRDLIHFNKFFECDILDIISQQNLFENTSFYRSSDNNGVWRSAGYRRKLTLDIREPNNVLFSWYMTFCERFSPIRMDRRERNRERGCIT